MKADEVPQDDSVLGDHRRAVYATDARGRYVAVASRGWEVEKIVNAQANEEIRATVEAARLRVRAGRASALEYYMLRAQMTPGLLASYAGLASLRVRWHLRPAVFRRLPTALLRRYADALGIDVETLRVVPDRPEVHR